MMARLLSMDEHPRYRHKPRGSKLDPYKGIDRGDPGGGCGVPAKVIIERLRR